MTPKENMRKVIEFNNPEYVPNHIPGFCLAYNGSNHQNIDGSGGDASPAGTYWTDIWGVGWYKELDDMMGLPKFYPLADITKVDSHSYPDLNDPRISDPIHSAEITMHPDEGFLMGFHRDTLFEQAYMLAGMENLMISIYDNPAAVKSLLHHITNFHIQLAKLYASKGVEWVNMGDDLGHQNGLLFSRDILEEFFVPEYHRLTDIYKANSVYICFHSCGQIQDILDIFMDIGVNVLNPVQATANNLSLVRERTQGKMTLMGGVSSKLIHEGPISLIQQDVREKIRLLGKSGGYICTPDQAMPFPQENISAFNQSVEEFGKYPII
jgi:uroporphyrinogen decarboxylase